MESADETFLASVKEFLQTCNELEIPSLSAEEVNGVLDVQAEPSAFRQNPDGSDNEATNPNTVDRRKAARNLRDRQRRRELRDRQMAERERLKSQVKELSALLEKRKKPRNDSRPHFVTKWRTVAQWYSEARLTAEKRHKMLSAAVKSRAKLIRELKSSVTKMVRSKKLVRDQLHCGAVSDQDHLDLFGSEINAAYIQELPAIYAQTDQVFLSRGPDSHLNFVTIWTKDAENGYLECTDRRVMALEFHQACQTLWLASHMPQHQQERYEYCVLENPENTIAVKFRIPTRLVSASVTQHSVSRRYEEENRIVIVWRSFLEGEGSFTGLHYDETGWCVAKRSTLGFELEVCVRDAPMHLRADAKDAENINQFTEAVLSMKADCYKEIETVLGNLHQGLSKAVNG